MLRIKVKRKRSLLLSAPRALFSALLFNRRGALNRDQRSLSTKKKRPMRQGRFLLYTGVAGGLLHVMVPFEFELRDRLDVGALAFPGDRSV